MALWGYSLWLRMVLVRLANFACSPIRCLFIKKLLVSFGAIWNPSLALQRKHPRVYSIRTLLPVLAGSL